MTYKYDNVYVKDTVTIAGPLEKKGPISKYFDKTYDDYYFGMSCTEDAEVKVSNEAINILLNKTKMKPSSINLLIGGDLSNQIAVSSYSAVPFKIPYFGVYNACATSMEQVIIASSLIDSGKINNCICFTSSHNLVSEKQFRNPVEYGAPKPLTATFTSTGGACIMLQNEKTNIKVTSSTIGTMQDLNYKDCNNVGAAMSYAAADTIYKHITNMKEDINSYDLILTGDLGIYGKAIMKDYMKIVYKISLGKNYDDCGTMLYDFKHQKEITAGGSGPVCSCLVNYSYIYDLMKKQKLRKVLLVTTGALYNSTFLFQKRSIIGIAHAVCLEVVS